MIDESGFLLYISISEQLKGINMRKAITIKNIEKAYKNPVATLVELACSFDSSISLISEDKNINAKSLLGVMAFGLKNGMSLDVHIEGSDEEKAMDKIVDFFLTEKKKAV